MKVVLAMSNQRSVVQQINEQKDSLLDCAYSLLEWEMFTSINPVQYIAETVLSFSFLWFYLSQQRMETTYKMPSFVIDE